MKQITLHLKSKTPAVILRIFIFVMLLSILTFISQLLKEIFIGVVLIDIFNISITEAMDLLYYSISILVATVMTIYIFRKHYNIQTHKDSINSQNLYSSIFFGGIVVVFIIGLGTILLSFFSQIIVCKNDAPIGSTIIGFLTFSCIAIAEELIFRGYILSNILSITNKITALLVSSIFFSVFHLFNVNVSFIGFANLFLLGILLGLLYYMTNHLWLSICLHLFWNFTQGTILGYAVSGLSVKSIFHIEQKGTEILTGGDFGYEGSIICTLLTTITIVYALAKHKQHQQTSKGVIH